MFDVVPGYDRANTVMTLGLDRRWRLATARVLG
jgi:demethylmenaquinone methyltransferase / 2-methoxy-6-polyprenyl-1,4-benzoquinol methylase